MVVFSTGNKIKRFCLVMVDETVIARSVATKQSQTIDILRDEIVSPSTRNDITN